MPKLSHMLNYSKTLPLQQPFSEMAKKKYQNNENVLVKYSISLARSAYRWWP